LLYGTPYQCHSLLVICMLQNIVLWQLYLQLAMITPRHHYKHVSLSTLVFMTSKWSNGILHFIATQPTTLIVFQSHRFHCHHFNNYPSPRKQPHFNNSWPNQTISHNLLFSTNLWNEVASNYNLWNSNGLIWNHMKNKTLQDVRETMPKIN
jgi:hypothetical protein